MDDTELSAPIPKDALVVVLQKPHFRTGTPKRHRQTGRGRKFEELARGAGQSNDERGFSHSLDAVSTRKQVSRW